MANAPPGAGLGFYYAPGKGQIRGFPYVPGYLIWTTLDLTFQRIKKVKKGILFRAFWNAEYLKAKKREWS